MLSLVTLPITWLAFYGLGRIPSTCSIDTRRYLVTVASLALLLGAAGLETWTFYVGLGFTIILAGQIISRLQTLRSRKVSFIAAVVFVVLVIVAFLQWRIYFQKFFPALPSLSYLGFRGIAYLTSAYKRPNVKLSAALMQMFFFPMLFLGPIARVENFEQRYENYREVLERLAMGLSMLIAGFLCGQYVIDDLASATNYHWSRFWLGALANWFEFYFTFAGYSHLVIGLGILAGFKLPENFDYPYLAVSISDFWRRWHMSLSYWIRDYVYIPLGGNRKGVGWKCLNLITAMVLVGVWHGLALHYFLWGMFHGVLLAAESLFTHFHLKVPLVGESKSVKVVFTFLTVSFSWLLFKYPLPDLSSI